MWVCNNVCVSVTVCVYTYNYMHMACIYVSEYKSKCVYIYLCIYAYIWANMCVICLSACMFVSAYVFKWHACIYLYTHSLITHSFIGLNCIHTNSYRRKKLPPKKEGTLILSWFLNLYRNPQLFKYRSNCVAHNDIAS